MKKFFDSSFRVLLGVLAALILISAALASLYLWNQSRIWRGYLFSTAFADKATYGSNLKEVGEFKGQEECLIGLREYRLKNKEIWIEDARSPESKTIANGCLCGRKCSSEARFSVDLNCEELASCN